MNHSKSPSFTANDTSINSDEYFSQRQLKQGSVGWILLIGLGVAYVISGISLLGILD
jgi:ethanolamine permease